MKKSLLLTLIALSLALNSNANAKTGLVLSGGGAKGFAHIGVLKELDKAGVKIDYIAGTSMGCIIGALYAIGYSGEDLEKMVLEENWMGLFDDRPSRKYTPMYEKDENQRYVGAFNISGDKSFLPAGIISGQEVYTMFSSLTWDTHGIEDFNKLPIPLVCVAADIETGERVVLNKGSLAQAMRASMSIPTIFAPVEKDGRLLVDGGIVDNFPVSEAKRMGADVVIGVDVMGSLYTKNEIDSFFKVMEQVISLSTKKTKEDERRRADILVNVNTNEYSIASFDRTKEIITKGENAVKPLMARINSLPKTQQKRHYEKGHHKKFNIASIKVEGLKKVSHDFVMVNLGFEAPHVVEEHDVEIAIEKIYGTQFFDSVTYEISPLGGDEFELTVRVQERSTSLLKFGFNYSSYTKAALLLNTTFKNTLGQDSKLSLDFNLSENPAFRGQYYVYSSRKPGLGFRTEMLFNKFDITTYQNGVAEAIYRFSYYALSLNLETNFSNYMLLGLGVDKEFTSRNPSVWLPNVTKNYDEFLTLSLFFKIDTLDSITYPKRGIKIDGDAKMVTDGLSLQNGIDHKTFERLSLNSKFAIPFGGRVSFIADAFIGGSIGEDIPYEYLFYFGGFRANYKWFLPFVGLDYMSASGPNALVLGGSMQFEVLKDIYLILKGNIGKLSSQFTDIFNSRDDLLGAGVTLGWDTMLIGPVEVTFMQDIKKKNFVASVSLGYWF